MDGTDQKPQDKDFFEVEELDDQSLEGVAGGSMSTNDGCINGSCGGSSNSGGCENTSCGTELA